MVTQNHAVNIKIGIEQQIKQIQQSLPKTFEAHGYDPATAKSMASNVFQTYASAHQLAPVMAELEALKGKRSGPKLIEKSEALGKQAAALFDVLQRDAPFSYGSVGTVTHTSAVDLATGMVARRQSFPASQAQLAAARRETFLRVIASQNPVTGYEPQYAKYMSPDGSITTLRASTPGEIRSNLKKLSQQRPGFRPSYYDPSVAAIEARLAAAVDLSLPEAQRAEALYFAQTEASKFSGRYQADIQETASIARGDREISRDLTRQVRSAKYKGRLAKLKGAVAAGGARTAGLAGAVTAAEAAATTYDNMMATGREPQARYDLESQLSELEAGAAAARGPTEERAYSTTSRLRQARDAERKLQQTLLGPVDLSAPGKRRSVTLNAEQQARYAQARVRYAAAEAIHAAPTRTKSEDAEANLLAKKANDTTRELIKEVRSNTKEQKDNTKMLADYDRTEAVGMGVVTRSIGSRAYGILAGIPGVSGADLSAYAGTGGLKFITGTAQDLALNSFIQNRSAASFTGLAASTIANVASTVFGSFVDRGLQIRKEVAQLRGDRHLSLGQILNPSPIAESFNTGVETFKPGVEYNPKEFYNKYGITMAEAARVGGASLDIKQTDLYGQKAAIGRDFVGGLMVYAQLSHRKMSSSVKLSDTLAKAITLGARSSVLDKERSTLEGIINTSIDRYGYGGAVSGSDMLKAAGAISAEGIPIQRLARSLYGTELSFVGPGGTFQPGFIRGGITGKSGIPYQAGVSELAIGAYATAIAKSSGLSQSALQSAIAMQGMGLSNIGLGVNPRTTGVSSIALSNFSAAIREGLPVSAASQILSSSLALNREGMFTDLTSMAAHTRGLYQAGITPGAIGTAKVNMMQLGRGAYGSITEPYRRLSSSMTMLYALEKSGGDMALAMETLRTLDTSSPDYIRFQTEHLGGELGATTLQAVTRLPKADVPKFIDAKPKEMSFVEAIDDEKFKSFAFQSSLKPGELANKADIARAKADKTVSEEEIAGARERSLESISISLSRVADYLGTLVGM
jgi:hypothetical protein